MLLEEAAPAAGLRTRLQAGPAARAAVAAVAVAVAELRRPLADAERYGLRERFAQASVDLLRGPGSEQAALAAGAECEGDPEACRRLFERLTRTGPAAAAEPRRR
ncbi:hypothetical protein [Streptomyces omiyaensis]|uniref:hypothetical protein n=1 Tax=Streptomyces omiyaensis TaxID=68247 RepID=UPI00167926C0|nr:hypothetical protein [Streptomyces omiyaensis]